MQYIKIYRVKKMYTSYNICCQYITIIFGIKYLKSIMYF